MTVMRTDPNASASNQLQIEQADELLDELEDSDDERPRGDGKRAGRRKIRIEYIGDKSRRHITFSKRKAGIMKKAYELSTLTGTQVLLLVASETGHVYTFATPKLQPLITKQEGKNLIQACLNSPDLPTGIPEYPLSSSASSASVSGTQSVPSAYESGELVEDDPNRSTSSAFSALTGLSGYAPYTGMVPSSSITPTPSASGNSSASAASAAAAAAAQVFMNPQVGGYSYASNAANNPSAAYWQGNPNMYASSSGKMNPSVQSQQQQLYTQAMYQQQQQQQQYMQQLHHQQHQHQQAQQQQHHHHHLHHQHQQQQASQSNKSGLLDLSENIVDHE